MEARLSSVERLAAQPVWNERACQVYRAGRLPYREAWELQREWAELRRTHQIPDRLLLVEHPPVITIGRNGRREHILSSPDILACEGIEVVETNRGGDVTFHGPGQLVGYPVLDLGRIRKDVVWYLRTLEEALIRTIRELGLAAERRPGMTGAWVGEFKVAAIGVHLSRWITTHGFALNVSTPLGYFRHIIPCGISAYPVSSLEDRLGASVDRARIELRLAGHLGELLGLQMEWNEWPGRDQERRKSCPPPMC